MALRPSAANEGGFVVSVPLALEASRSLDTAGLMADPISQKGSTMQAAFWDERAAKYENDIKKHDALYARTIERTNALITGFDVVLDLGCASGEIGLDLAPRVNRLHGIDVSERMIDLANRKVLDRGVANADFRCVDVFATGFAPGSYSVVTAFNVFHLTDDVAAVLARLHELMEPSGLLISHTPCLSERSWWVRSLVAVAQKLGAAPPIVRLEFTQLESLISSSGFEILESEVWDAKDAVQRIVARRNP